MTLLRKTVTLNYDPGDPGDPGSASSTVCAAAPAPPVDPPPGPTPTPPGGSGAPPRCYTVPGGIVCYPVGTGPFPDAPPSGSAQAGQPQIYCVVYNPQVVCP